MGSTLSNPSSSDEESPATSNGSFLLREGDRQLLLRQLESIAASQETDQPNQPNQPSIQSNSSAHIPILNLVQSLQLGVRPLSTNSTNQNLRYRMDHDTASTSSMDSGSEDERNSSRQKPIVQAFCIPEAEPYKSSYQQLHSDIKNRCGFSKNNAPMSILNSIRKRELCSNWVNRHFISSTNRGRIGGFSLSEKVNFQANFFPNRRRKVDSLRAKTFCVGYINNGNGLMTASQDHKIRLYEKSGPKRRYFLNRSLDVPYVGWSILDVVVSPDGRDIVYSTWNEAMYQCNINEGDEENWIPLRVDASEARFALFSIRFNKNGTEIVAGSTDQHLYIYNRECCSSVLALKAHDDDVNAVCFGDEGSNILLSGADDGLVKVWDRRTMGEFGRANPVGVFAGHADGITFIDSRGDDRYFLSNSKDQTIKVWDIRNFASDKGINSTRESVKKQQWDYRWQLSPEDHLMTTRMDGDCSILTLRGHSVLHTLVRARFSPEHTGRRFIYSGCGRGNCLVYDLYTGEIKAVLQGHRGVVRDVAWSPNDNEIIAASWDGVTSMWTYDERYKRNINPNGGTSDNEDTTDEDYNPIQPKNGTRRRRAERNDDDSDDVRKTRQQTH